MKKIALALAMMASAAMASDRFIIGIYGGIQQLHTSPKINTRWSQAGDSLAAEAVQTLAYPYSQRGTYFDTVGSAVGQYGGTGGLRLAYSCEMDKMALQIGGTLSASGAKTNPEYSRLDFSKPFETVLIPGGREKTQYLSKGRMKIDQGLTMTFGPRLVLKSGPVRFGMGIQWRGTQYRVHLNQKQTNVDWEVADTTKERRKKFAHAVQLSFSTEMEVNPSLTAGMEVNYALPASSKFKFKKEYTLFTGANDTPALKTKPVVRTKIQSLEVLATVNFAVNVR